MIESIRKENRAVLLVDAGAVFDRDQDTARLHLQAMELMGYDALNLGSPELFFGADFLAHSRSSLSFPFLASNLRYGGSVPPGTREYLIKEVGGIRVAILGILDPEALKSIPRPNEGKEFEVISAQAALERLVPAVRKKADLVVLLSQSGEEEIQRLVKDAKGIDVMVTPPPKQALVRITPPSDMIVVTTGVNGMTLGLLTVTLNDSRPPTVKDRRHLPLDDSVAENPELARIVKAHEKELAAKTERAQREITEGLQLTPEQFMEQYLRKQKHSHDKKGEGT